MKIIHLVPGSGGSFYCENCLRDAALVSAQRAQGHDVQVVPLYLPVGEEAPPLQSDAPVFFGGINVYLQQVSAIFRRTPRWLDRLFDSRRLLKRVARRAGATRASKMGPLTLSMLRGENGHQAKEVHRLAAWLQTGAPPDVIHLSNALLSGVAAVLRRRLPRTALVCSLMDEDTWLDALAPPYDSLCWQTLADNARHLHAFSAPTRYYARFMAERLGLPADDIRVVPAAVAIPPADASPPPAPPNPPVVGFLSRLSPNLGLDILVDAYLILRKRPAFRSLRLRAAGGGTGDDKPFVRRLQKRVEAAGAAADASFHLNHLPEPRPAFLRKLTVLSVPAPNGLAAGTFLLEALAEGVPVVQPRVGAFPEILEATGGGRLCKPGDPAALADALAEILSRPDEARRLGETGRRAVREKFSPSRAATAMIDLYETVRKNRVTS